LLFRSAIENLSPEEEVYVQFGDIVKGGNQDRVLVTDLILTPQGGKVSIAAFCVEPGRWSRRGKEAAGSFSSSEQQLPSKDLKVAAGAKADQQEVWKAVGATRERLSRAAAVPGGAAGAGSGTFVAAPPPAMPASSSLALMVEAKEVRKSAEDYTKALGTTVNDKPDVVGYAFAVNGKLVGAEVYSSQSLFRGMWAKLLKAAALEAMADDEKDAKVEPVSSEAVKRFLDAPETPFAWAGDVRAFLDTPEEELLRELTRFARETGAPQLFAWDRSLGILRGELAQCGAHAERFGLVLEFELHRGGGRRPDLIVLEN